MPQTEKQQIGRYEILEEIGRGAMGVVFKGRDPLIGRDVAVKTIATGVAENADLRERFYREAKAAGVLQHPNIVTIYEMAESGGTPFIAMEYLEGESLEKLIVRQPALPLATKAGYVVQACRALEYAHRHGVVHRDVKPANIMVTRDGVVKVVDFGIARLADTSKTQTGMLLGTLAYMSPEQIRGQQAGALCDIWAMGVVLYELIAYQRPFTGENHAALLISILQNEPPSIRQFLPQCPPALERVISKALRKDEKERYASMEAFLKDLENVAGSLSREGSRTPAARPPLDPEAPPAAAQIPGAKAGAQPTPTVLVHSDSIAATPATATPIPRPGVRRTGKSILTEPRAPASHPGRTALVACAIVAIIAIAAFAVVRRDKASAAAARQAWARIVDLASHGPTAHRLPLATPNTQTPTAAAATSANAQTSPSADSATSAAAGGPTINPAPSSASSLEDQQRYLINLAQQAAGWRDYKGAQQQLDEAAKLNGPLNDEIADLRRQFSAESQSAESERVAQEEQTLWDKTMAYIKAGDLDDAEESLRDVLASPEVGHRWAEAARYVDQVIPEYRQEEQLWARAQLAASSRDPGHFLSEIKALDEVMVAGGRHEPGARQRRDAAMAAMIRDDAEGHGLPPPVVSNADQWQVTRLKNQFDDLVQKGDAAALEKLQPLQSEFKSAADARGPLVMDALDYLNNLVPMAQRHIQDRLALAQSNSAPNAAYMDAVKEFNRAVAAQNAPMLRDKVLPLFREIAQSGSVRAKEAQHYADVLIPAALKDAATVR
jgi:eukaryotic-like serine/threonine-protein kinase